MDTRNINRLAELFSGVDIKKKSRSELQREVDRLRLERLQLRTDIEVMIMHPDGSAAAKIRAKHLKRIEAHISLNRAVEKVQMNTVDLQLIENRSITLNDLNKTFKVSAHKLNIS